MRTRRYWWGIGLAVASGRESESATETPTTSDDDGSEPPAAEPSNCLARKTTRWAAHRVEARVPAPQAGFRPSIQNPPLPTRPARDISLAVGVSFLVHRRLPLCRRWLEQAPDEQMLRRTFAMR
jgi:hypothetical protein